MHMLDAVPLVIVVVVHHVGEEAVKVIELASGRSIRSLQSEVPLADDGGGVAGWFKDIGNELGGGVHESPVGLWHGAYDAGNADSVGVAAVRLQTQQLA